MLSHICGILKNNQTHGNRQWETDYQGLGGGENEQRLVKGCSLSSVQ